MQTARAFQLLHTEVAWDGETTVSRVAIGMIFGDGAVCLQAIHDDGVRSVSVWPDIAAVEETLADGETSIEYAQLVWVTDVVAAELTFSPPE